MTKRVAVATAEEVAVAVAAAVVGEGGADERQGGCWRTTVVPVPRTAVAVGYQHPPIFGQNRSWTRRRNFACCRNPTKLALKATE